MSAWVVALVGVIGVVSGLLGQALYWGHFKGSIQTSVTLLREEARRDIEDLKGSRSTMWNEINDHGERLTALETACEIRYANPARAKGIHG